MSAIQMYLIMNAVRAFSKSVNDTHFKAVYISPCFPKALPTPVSHRHQHRHTTTNGTHKHEPTFTFHTTLQNIIHKTAAGHNNMAAMSTAILTRSELNFGGVSLIEQRTGRNNFRSACWVHKTNKQTNKQTNIQTNKHTNAL
jgi:hypothetical protein